MMDFENMTLTQAKEYCYMWRNSHQAPCEGTGCELLRRHICMDWVHEWDFDCLTPDELEICKAVGAKFVSVDKAGSGYVSLWRSKPMQDICGEYKGIDAYMGCISHDLFPSIKPGDCINVEELI